MFINNIIIPDIKHALLRDAGYIMGTGYTEYTVYVVAYNL